ncbi:tyrosine-type recombinase/integrase [Streptomyces globosus]|uniref:tyrosine-type recombinase/integrase n=1 Tax=Streptomyces sp. WAC05292 TaxID=2487418 RepID=UPI0021AFA687|nr:site-specific integrase [Streptomyces sp. WAC05292]
MANVHGTLVPTYTARNRRTVFRDMTFDEPVATRFPDAAVKAAPAPRPDDPPAPFGDLSRTSVLQLCSLVEQFAPGLTHSTYVKRRRGLRLLFEHLETLPGADWQAKWENSPFDGDKALPVNTLVVSGSTQDRQAVTSAAKLAFCARVIRPSVGGFRANRFGDYPESFGLASHDPALEAFYAAVDARSNLGLSHRIRVKFDIACALTTQGIGLEHLTPEALLHYSLECRRLGVTHGASKDQSCFAARGAWEILHSTGHFPPGTPATLRKFIYTGQLTPEQLVDRYPLRNQGIRRLIIDYLLRRQADTDYVTRDGLARILAGTFWSKIEQIHPDQASLALGQDVWDQWRAHVAFWERDRAKERKNTESILLAIRGFYLDLQSWAVEEPERWVPWVAPCPVRPEDLKGFSKRRREINRRMADRTRQRQPLLPGLVKHVEERHERFCGLLEAARQVGLGESFEHGGRRYRRSDSTKDQRRFKIETEPPVRIHDEDTGELINVTFAEDSAFWEWAAIEVLRHSGIRIEELSELTHLSVRQYERPNGEVIALLVITPSKNDRERVIPMSADLFHAIAQIIRRHHRGGQTIPLVSRYDGHEKTWSDPMPFLFQRQVGSIRSVLATGTMLNMLRRTCKAIGETNRAFAGLAFTPHDFRRLFATEIVNGGLPIHIGAALLGHLNLQTTQGYVAVFNEDVVAHYQRFLNNRRALRPAAEYGEVTEQEWAEFQEHFEKRKVELGSCARPYGTPCRHEHACIRCPVLQVNPKMVARLDELEKDLLLRRQRAQAESWLGEIDGIDQTLVFLRGKRAEALRLTRRTPVDLGLPRPRS